MYKEIRGLALVVLGCSVPCDSPEKKIIDYMAWSAYEKIENERRKYFEVYDDLGNDMRDLVYE